MTKNEIQLIPVTTDDLELVKSLYCDESTMRYIFEPLNINQAEQLLNEFMALAKSVPPTGYLLKINSSSNNIVGLIGASTKDSNMASFDAGAMILPEYNSHGYGTSALRSLIKLLKNTSYIQFVRVQSMKENLGAFHVMKKLNFDIEFESKDEEGTAWINWKLELRS